MSEEFWAIIGVGITLGALMITGNREIQDTLAKLDRRVAHIEGFLMRGNGEPFCISVTGTMLESLRGRNNNPDT